jgi:hypothetical protein
MQYVPVDTIICFRASCPLVIAVIEYFYLDRELPSFRSWASLIGARAPAHPARPPFTDRNAPAVLPRSFALPAWRILGAG